MLIAVKTPPIIKKYMIFLTFRLSETFKNDKVSRAFRSASGIIARLRAAGQVMQMKDCSARLETPLVTGPYRASTNHHF